MIEDQKRPRFELTVCPGDSYVKLTWLNFPDVECFSVYYAAREFGGRDDEHGPYRKANGVLFYSIVEMANNSGISRSPEYCRFDVWGLINNVCYQFVVEALMKNGKIWRSNAAAAMPVSMF
jgi:hypothetical protein